MASVNRSVVMHVEDLSEQGKGFLWHMEGRAASARSVTGYTHDPLQIPNAHTIQCGGYLQDCRRTKQLKHLSVKTRLIDIELTLFFGEMHGPLARPFHQYIPAVVTRLSIGRCATDTNINTKQT